MKILTILGTRPEIIRMSRIIETIDKFSENDGSQANYDTF